MDEIYKTAREVGYNNNKDIKFKKIKGIYIKKFRTIENKMIELGNQVTIISGKNGTMKSCILGLLPIHFLHLIMRKTLLEMF